MTKNFMEISPILFSSRANQMISQWVMGKGPDERRHLPITSSYICSTYAVLESICTQLGNPPPKENSNPTARTVNPSSQQNWPLWFPFKTRFHEGRQFGTKLRLWEGGTTL